MNLANSYSYYGDDNKAIELGTLAMNICKQTLGENHPEYARSLSNLAGYYGNLGDYNKAIEATNILFGNTTHETLSALSEERFMEIFGENVESYEIPMEELKAGIGPLDLLAEKTNIFPSKGEARKMIQANGFSLNKEKLTDPATPLTDAALLNGKYLLFQKGKKNYYLVVAK